VVTAQWREQDLQKTAVTITALDATALADRGIVDVQGISRSVPNLQLLPVTANPSTLQVALRGGAEQVGRRRFDRTSIASASQFTQEIQLQGEAIEGRMNWIVGGFVGAPTPGFTVLKPRTYLVSISHRM